MRNFEEYVVWPKDFPEDKKDWMLSHLRHQAKMKTMVYIFYKMNCKCGGYITYLLDRYPMSKKVITICQLCNKGTVANISRPIQFHIPVNDTKFFVKDLKNMELNEDSPQFVLLDAYRKGKRLKPNEVMYSR